ncbi:MAG: iron-containing alcohol dehydrogenase [Clostridia bacterium]|nr:iron-containing alcohol dehydrogenase [Clostridia bacterium]
MLKIFDFENQIKNLFKSESESEVIVSSVNDALFNLASENAGKKIDLVFTEKDYIKFGKIITAGLKKACAEYSTLLIEDLDFDHVKNKSFFNFKGEIIIVVGSKDLISITQHYASLLKKKVHAVPTEPNNEYLLLNYAKLPTNGVTVTVEVNTLKSVIIDVEIIKKASDEAFKESFVHVFSKLITLIDYKYRSLITGEQFDIKGYQNVKNAISLIAGISSYENKKELLIYAEAVLFKEKKASLVLKDGAVELFVDALYMFSSELRRGDAIFNATRIISEVYEMLFVNDLTGLLSVPDYNQDLAFLEKTTGISARFFRESLEIPTPRRLELINKVLTKTSDGFKKEIESVLSILKVVEKMFGSLFKISDEKPPIYYNSKRQALLLCTYLNKNVTILSHMRDMGVLRCVDEK